MFSLPNDPLLATAQLLPLVDFSLSIYSYPRPLNPLDTSIYRYS